jgi:hypothetical protein
MSAVAAAAGVHQSVGIVERPRLHAGISPARTDPNYQWCQPRRLTFESDEASDTQPPDVRPHVQQTPLPLDLMVSEERSEYGADDDECHSTDSRLSRRSNSTATATGTPLPTRTTHVPPSRFDSASPLQCRPGSWLEWVESTLATYDSPTSHLDDSKGQDHAAIDVHVAVNLDVKSWDVLNWRWVVELPHRTHRLAYTTFSQMSSRTNVNDLCTQVLFDMRLPGEGQSVSALMDKCHGDGSIFRARCLRTLPANRGDAERYWSNQHLSRDDLVGQCLVSDRPNHVFVGIQYYPKTLFYLEDV